MSKDFGDDDEEGDADAFGRCRSKRAILVARAQSPVHLDMRSLVLIWVGGGREGVKVATFAGQLLKTIFAWVKVKYLLSLSIRLVDELTF